MAQWVAAQKAKPEPVRWETPYRPCRECKVLTGWRTPLGSPVHPMCVNTWKQLVPLGPPEVAAALHTLARMLGPLREVHDERADPDYRWRPIRFDEGQCSWCREPSVGLRTDDGYYHCPGHLFSPYKVPRDLSQERV